MYITKDLSGKYCLEYIQKETLTVESFINKKKEKGNNDSDSTVDVQLKTISGNSLVITARQVSYIILTVQLSPFDKNQKKKLGKNKKLSE